jgi:PBP1b-binding outer membrane lipoprotein LpoB
MKSIFLMPPLAILLAGCSVVAKEEVLKDAQKQCAAKGMKFVQTEIHQNEFLVAGSAEIEGQCVPPDAPTPARPAV